jgi:hypothetical protein
MGYNLYSACHKCKVQVFHYRNEEQLLILPFYKKHSECAKEDINNVQTVMDNNGTDQKWMRDFENGGYKTDSLEDGK